MGDKRLSKALKDLPYRVQTASLKERKEVVEDVIYVLPMPGVSANIVRGICKVIQLTLPRYRDSSSQQLVRNLIFSLIEHHPDNAIKGLCGILLDIAKLHKNLVVTSNTCQTGLYALHWSCILLTHGWKQNDVVLLEHIPQIVEIQSILYSNVEAGNNAKRSTKAFNLLNSAFEKIPDCEKLYLETMKNLEQSPSIVVFSAAIAKRLSLIKNTSLFENYVENVLDSYIKNFISCKNKPSVELISACSPIFFSVTEEHFKKSLLPAILKAMLRNPEVLIECMPMIIRNASVKLDLSAHAMGIGESIIANLYSKNDQARDDAANALQALALGITQASAIESLIVKIFSVLDGSQGKLTVVDHKISVLEGAGKLSICHTKLDKDTMQALIPKVIDLFIKVLSLEVAEKSLCHCLEMLSLWTSKLEAELPKKLIETIKKGMTVKTATPLVRTSYLKLILRSKFLPSKELIPVILKSVENAVNQSSNAQSVTEGLCAVCVLLKVVSLSNDKENGFHNMWHIVLDMDKQVFVSEKFLSSASPDGLVLVMELCEKLLLNYPDKLGAKTSPLYKAVIFCVTSGSSQVRRTCFPILKSMVNDDNRGSSLARALFHEFTVFLDSPAVKSTIERRLKDQTDSTDISPHALVECISTLCSSTKLSVEHKELLALDAILPCHHPVVSAAAPGLWLKIVKHLGIQPKDLVVKYIAQFKSDLIENYHTSSAKQFALASIVQISPEKILPPLIETVINNLQDPRICQMSKDDYFTFLTPEGELYDKSVIPGDDSNKEMNMKRESKAYSYKEQLEELQLRRELEEKKRKAGKLQAPKYTQKQLEAINNQKAKEQAIRSRLSEVNAIVINSVSMIKAASMGNPTEVSLYLKDLLPVLIKGLQSPLAAPYLSKLFTDLRCVVFSQADTSAEIIAFITLRLLKPQCDLDANWEEEDLNKAMLRTMNLIYEKTVKRRSEDNKLTLFSAPAFCYTFPFLRSSFLSDYANKHEEFLFTGIQIITEHSKLRGGLGDKVATDYSMPRDASNGSLSKNRQCSKDVYHPRYLPSGQMFELLIHIINQTSGRVQSQAEACLLDVAKCLSGKEDCSEASKAEIDVLLEALQRPEPVVRDAALRALTILIDCLPTFESDSSYALKLNKRVWIAKFDEMKENCVLADELWNLGEMNFPTELSDELLVDVELSVQPVQAAAAKALAALLEMNRRQVQQTLTALLKMYQDKLEMIPPILDEFGREIEPAIDTWQPRRGVALAINEIAPLITPLQIGDIIEFFVNSSLRDRNETVRIEMLNAALKLVDLHGKETVGTLWPVFDKFMGTSSKQAHFDAVKQAVVILMGSLARHLDEDDNRIKPIVTRLVQALNTPSQTVQEAVAKCLPHLCSSVKEEAPGIVNKLLHQLLKGDKYGERKGAAYGLAGMIKGMGILALKQQDIMTKLTDAIQDKKNYKFREGALFAFEMLFQMLGKLFEPYIVHVLPHLLQCFGDSSQHVRTAADDTAKVIMSKLSGHGVKLILPSLLEALNEDSWRTKTGSVELLGAMAYCAPKQLSSCLPSIVPKLIEVLSDSHMKVQEAGADALKVIGSVIRNPEIQAIVPVLLKALQDPSNKTSACLQTLLDTQFVHFIDAPSLALIMPVVQRAFMDRSTETRKMAAQIIGNMYSLTDQKDLMPYLPTIIPGLKTSLLDPVPEVRSVSARALGAMVRGMGESSFEDLLPWLMQTLTSESSSVDRSGAAQGLSEVVGGLGVEKLHKLMPEIISTAERSDIAPHVKDGYIMMFIYMPVVFTSEFTPYIGQIITPILKALADENEYVRETALKAGQRIVTLYADSAILLLLPELEKGLFDENWRIRYSSVQLLGDLLYRISGVTGKMSTETASEDDNFGTEQSHYAIINSLGEERRNRVLAGLYMGRSDVALMVRQAALHVWKVVVTNTPRTLREILPTLFGLLLGCLASDSFDKRQVAARTLGDLVRKLGERVLPEIIPILERGLQSERPDQRQGVCIGLSEIMFSTSRDMVLTFVNSLVPTVRKALCDPLPEVREAAARTFDSLHSTVGTRALDDILPTMLNQLNDDDPEVVECTLDGLRQVMAIKSRVVLPYLVPQLTAPPANTKALSILASVAGESLNKYLPRILPALQVALSSSKGTPEEAQQMEYCTAVVLSIVDESGVRIVIDTMLENTKNEDPNNRIAAATLLCAFCANSKAQYQMHVPQLLRGLILLCTDNNQEVLKMAFEALSAITKNLDSKQLATYVQDVRLAVRYAMSDLKGTSDVLPGFCLAKGISPILPIFREAILNGDNDEKELATLTLGEVIRVTSSTALQQNVIAITGPLIRILGDRFTPNIKIAVLDTLAVLLSKVGILMKQFLPQLQTTFIKALSDSTRMVRMKASAALSHLIKIHLRPDPVFTEIHNLVQRTEDPAIRETALSAMRGVISNGGDKLADPIKKQMLATLRQLDHFWKNDEVSRLCAAGCLGVLCQWLNPEDLNQILTQEILCEDRSSPIDGHTAALVLSVIIKESAAKLWETYQSEIIAQLLYCLVHKETQVVMVAIRTCGYLFKYLVQNNLAVPQNLLSALVRITNRGENEVKQHFARVCMFLAKNVPTETWTDDLLKHVLPTLVMGTKEKNMYVKANSEIALIAILRLREGTGVQTKCMKVLDEGARESLNDVVVRVLKKVALQPEGKEEELDETLLT
ncbi:eIF-2-alpha kinase activator GCN1 [Harmonia axyridis]|uniref:eIF-2-alpha kinase activator GCN1 n=1 Tax=Harmonia axyridis TaxID=115357 RepID=UPI001E279150|nr:eIF-2-alpha kinase activator GCN1 [Harmonia axyridis]